MSTNDVLMNDGEVAADPNAQAADVSRVRLVVAQVPGAILYDIPAEGILVRELPGYKSNMAYMVGSQSVGPDFRLMPGQGVIGVFAAQAHDNG